MNEDHRVFCVVCGQDVQGQPCPCENPERQFETVLMQEAIVKAPVAEGAVAPVSEAR